MRKKMEKIYVNYCRSFQTTRLCIVLNDAGYLVLFGWLSIGTKPTIV